MAPNVIQGLFWHQLTPWQLQKHWFQWFLIGCRRILDKWKMVLKTTTIESKTKATAWRSVQSWIRNRCQSNLAFFRITHQENKRWGSCDFRNYTRNGNAKCRTDKLFSPRSTKHCWKRLAENSVPFASDACGVLLWKSALFTYPTSYACNRENRTWNPKADW